MAQLNYLKHCEGKVDESAPSPPDSKDMVVKERERAVLKLRDGEERVKMEVCLTEEGKGKEEEHVWEEDIKVGTGAEDFWISTSKRGRKRNMIM